jgi:hypothetical protein
MKAKRQDAKLLIGNFMYNVKLTGSRFFQRSGEALLLDALIIFFYLQH